MNVKKYGLMSLVIIILLSFFVIAYGKTSLLHVNYDEYISQSRYTNFSKEQYLGMYPYLGDFFIDDVNVNSYQDLVDLSDYVVIVNIQEQPLLYGKGIINNCAVKEVVKGDKIKEMEIIKVYNLISYWSLVYTGYFGGGTPLKIGEEYILFLKDAPNPNQPNTFVFSSVEYGSINLSNSVKILTEYEQYDLNIKEAQEYDYIFGTEVSQDMIEKYKIIRDDIIKLSNIQK